jgi:hypothetical protein
MSRYPAVLTILAALGGAALSATGQPANPAAARPPTGASAPAGPAADSSSRPESAEVAAELAIGMPKYDPPKPPPPPTPEEQQADLRDLDKPKNGIVRLPAYMVHEPRPTVFREWDLYSKEGLARLALQRYRGLGLMPFAGMNKLIATELYEADERLQNMADLDATAQAMARGGDKSESEYVKRISQDTYMRGIDWGGTVPSNDAAIAPR